MSSKVEPQHLERKACVYVRQSTVAQVERNAESRERQYELVDRAVALGWRAPEVAVVDEDQGGLAGARTGAPGFSRWSPKSASVGGRRCCGCSRRSASSRAGAPATARCGGRPQPTRRSTRSSPTPCTRAPTRTVRKQTERRVTDGAVTEHVRRTPREQWHVCIEGHHPGYITFERYLANQQLLRSNWRAPRARAARCCRG